MMEQAECLVGASSSFTDGTSGFSCGKAPVTRTVFSWSYHFPKAPSPDDTEGEGYICGFGEDLSASRLNSGWHNWQQRLLSCIEVDNRPGPLNKGVKCSSSSTNPWLFILPHWWPHCLHSNSLSWRIVRWCWGETWWCTFVFMEGDLMFLL